MPFRFWEPKVPDFTADDKVTIDKYVNDRLAKGDKATDINRDLTAHWREMDAARDAASAVEPDPGPPQEMPLPGFHVTGSGAAPHEATAPVGPMTDAAVKQMLQQGRSVREISEMINKQGMART
jgi:hypothetical protein